MANLRKAADRIRKKAAPAKAAAVTDPATPAGDKPEVGPSPNPMTNMILADIALRGGGALLRRAVEGSLLGRVVGKKKARKVIKGQTMAQTLMGTALARVATRSVPGAIVVGGGLLAKTLYDRKRGKRAKRDGHEALDAQAEKA